MDSFGEYLRKERELRHIELDEISKITKIKKAYFQAIENDTYEDLPDIALVKGFIRAYCNYIGLNTEQTINYFQQFYNEKFSKEEQPRASFLKTYLHQIKLAIYIVVPLLLVGISLILYHSMGKSKEQVAKYNEGVQQLGLTSTTFTKPITANPALITQTVVSETVTGTSITSTTISQHTLLLKATEDTWVRLVPDEDEKTAREALLKPGEQVLWKFTGTALLTVGNAQGVNLILDNKVLQHNKRRAEVIKLKL